VGLAVDTDPPHVWHQQVISPGSPPGYEGVVNDYFLVRTASFRPRGAMSDDELAAENIDGFRWWPLRDIADYRGPELFSPRDLASSLAALIADGVPNSPVPLGL
jgi:8-oxo-dGTP diphosphatase